MEEDIFADLLSGSGSKGGAKGASAARPENATLPGPSPARAGSEPGARAAPGVALPPDAFLEGAAPDANGRGGSRGGAPAEPLLAISRADLEALLSSTVQSAVNSAMSKLAHSLKTVLEDMSRRIEANGAAAKASSEALASQLAVLAEASESAASNSHTRFSSVDIALKDIERGVQALRDRQELVEAQVGAPGGSFLPGSV